jgi:hypothetical protein
MDSAGRIRPTTPVSGEDGIRVASSPRSPALALKMASGCG